MIDPATGQPVIQHQRLMTAENDVLYLGSVPVFYWPTIATDLNDPTYYIRRVQARSDTVFGTEQLLTNWSGYDLLGIKNKPKGTDLDVSLDYLSARGFGYGATYKYEMPSLFGVPGRAAGLLDYWGIQDHGIDNLGQGRSDIPPEASYRFRLWGEHRQELPYDLQLTAELGWISDRNFLEEYYKTEWDTLKNETTDVELKGYYQDMSYSVVAQYRLNGFFTDTNWLPRADHFWLGQPLLRNTLTWYEHTNVGYAQFRQLTVPENPTLDGPFNYLPWEAVQRARRPVGHPAGARLAVPARRRQGRALRDGRSGPVGRGPGRPAADAAMGAGGHPGHAADVERRSDRFRRPAEHPRHRPQGDVRFRVLGRPGQPTPQPTAALRSAGQLLGRGVAADFMTDTFGVPSMITVPPGPPPRRR